MREGGDGSRTDDVRVGRTDDVRVVRKSLGGERGRWQKLPVDVEQSLPGVLAVGRPGLSCCEEKKFFN
jgi:hypothetical protein